MTVIFFRGGHNSIEALPPVAGESYDLVCGYGPEDADTDRLLKYDADGYIEAHQSAWTARTVKGHCPHCGLLAQGRGLTCGADACTDWYANVLPVMEALRLTELRALHAPPEPVEWRQLWPVALMAGSAGGMAAAVAFAVGAVQRWWG